MYLFWGRCNSTHNEEHLGKFYVAFWVAPAALTLRKANVTLPILPRRNTVKEKQREVGRTFWRKIKVAGSLESSAPKRWSTQSSSDESFEANSKLCSLLRELLAGMWLPQCNQHSQEKGKEPRLPKSTGLGLKQYLFMEGLSWVLLCPKGTHWWQGHCYAVWPCQALGPVASIPTCFFPSCRPPLPSQRALVFLILTQRSKAAVFRFPKGWAKEGHGHSRNSPQILKRIHPPWNSWTLKHVT